MTSVFRYLYLQPRVWIAAGGVVALFVAAHYVPFLFIAAQAALVILVALTVADIIILFAARRGIEAARTTPEKFSNGDENKVDVEVSNYYPFAVHLSIADEVPVQFQRRDIEFSLTAPSGGSNQLEYTLRPLRRGEYKFGALNVYASTPLGLAARRFIFSKDVTVPCYPSFMQMRRYELLAISNRLEEVGIKRMRRIGNSMEFEQIREYVQGDDIRTVNWKATARRSSYMVNEFVEEKSQPVYCIIDKGRPMKNPFGGMTLLDYAINASLVVTNIALYKQDRAGIATFSDKMGSFIAADRRAAQMQKIIQLLYSQKTRFSESNFEALYSHLKQKANHRSLVLLFTNFETMSGMQRQLQYLRKISKDHLLVVVFFEDTELRSLLEAPADTLEKVYVKTIAEKFAFEKKQIVKELQRHGIHSLLTTPQNLTVDTLNKYLEIKSRGMI